MRTHLGANDLAYRCIFQCEDEQGEKGVRLSKELMAVAGEALKVGRCACVCDCVFVGRRGMRLLG